MKYATKRGLSRDEHTELGEELERMHVRLLAINFQLAHAYPQEIGDPRLVSRVMLDLGLLRQKLDAIVLQEYPSLSVEGNARVYYPYLVALPDAGEDRTLT